MAEGALDTLEKSKPWQKLMSPQIAEGVESLRQSERKKALLVANNAKAKISLGTFATGEALQLPFA